MDFDDFVVPPGWQVPEGGLTASRCRSCEALVVWLVSASGRRAPFNFDGVTHFATCPSADRWRTRRPRR